MRSCRLLLRSEDPKNLRERAQSSCWVLGGCRGRLVGVFLLFFIPLGLKNAAPGPCCVSQALVGCTVEVRTLDGRLLNVPINDIVQ